MSRQSASIRLALAPLVAALLLAGCAVGPDYKRLAIARIEEAQAVLDETGSALLPEIDLNAASTRSRSSTFNAQRLPAGTPVISNSNRLALSTTFELDFWGKLRRATESACVKVLGSS